MENKEQTQGNTTAPTATEHKTEQVQRPTGAEKKKEAKKNKMKSMISNFVVLALIFA